MVLNGNSIEFDEGQTILEVALNHGVDIPTLCYLKDTTPTGACRICLVEVEGARNLVASCATPAAPDMIVKTDTDRVNNARRLNIELLLASGQHNCLVQDMTEDNLTDFQLDSMEQRKHRELCPAYGDCRLQEPAIRYQVKTGRFAPAETFYPIEDLNPFIVRDFSRCILCGRCGVDARR
ncbi:MAG: (2Fe-2S)-binding protein [Deltaproteobacteria bacterium]|nr:(2Fe-2S)-binding protein [Deltaproteobacteria bacterium]